jgi:hypothetical protein
VVDTSEPDVPRDTSPALGSNNTTASEVVLSSDWDAQSFSKICSHETALYPISSMG